MSSRGEKCIRALNNLKGVLATRNYDKELTKDYIEVLDRLIKDYFYNPPKIDGNTSDGYHTFNELYHHRAILFGIICNQNKEIAWKSKKHNDGTMYDGMFIVGVDTPQGQYSYHYDIEPYWGMFNVKELDKAPTWDGHEPKDIDRLLTINDNPPLKYDELKEYMWVWDNSGKRWIELYWDETDKKFEYYEIGSEGEYSFCFEENRYYRKQVKA